MGFPRLSQLVATWTVLSSTLILLCIVSSCATAGVTWWFNDGLVSKELIRKHTNAPTETLSYVSANGYLCLSPTDAEYAQYAILQLEATK